MFMNTQSNPISEKPTNSDSVPLILTFCIISAFIFYLVYTGNFVFGSKAGGWVYPYFDPAQPLSRWMLLIVLVILSLMIFFGSKLILIYEKFTLLGGYLLAVIVQLLIRTTYPITFEAIIKSDVANSFYTLAMRYSAYEILSQYFHLVSSFPVHVKSNMPGKILLFQFLSLFTTSPQMMGYMIVAFSTLGAFLLYGICVKLFHDRLTAYFAFILYLLLPCKLFFFPILNTVTPIFILLCLFLFLLYIESKKSLFLVLLGGAFYILVLFEPTPLVCGLIFVGILLSEIAEKKHTMKSLWGVVGISALSFSIIYLFFLTILSFNLFQSFKFILNDALRFNISDQRGYWIWVIENSKEFFYASGVPIMMIFIYLTVQTLIRMRTKNRTVTNWSIENTYILSLFVTFCIVVLLGINRGEITRLWIYLAVFLQIPAAFYLAKAPRSNALFFCVAGTLVIQNFISLQRVGFIMP
jgi:hypothetical protein